jgi:rhodanese-related sulfurtransferase
MKALFILILLSIPSGLTAQNCNSATLLETPEFKKQINSERIQLLDVRTPAEYQSGHIEGAFLVNVLNKLQFIETIKKLDKNKPVYIYCRSGSRSKTAAQLLCESGFNLVYDLKGGYLTWL